MLTDIVFPNNNEKEFLSLAVKLNTKILFCYQFGKIPKTDGNFAISTAANNLNRAINCSKKVLCNSNSREVFESHSPLFIYGLEMMSINDSMHTRHSGMNHIMASLAYKNGHTICFSPSTLPDTDSRDFPMILGRMMQNIKLCRKYLIKMKLASFASSPYRMRAEKEIESFGIFLGMDVAEAKGALSFI